MDGMIHKQLLHIAIITKLTQEYHHLPALLVNQFQEYRFHREALRGPGHPVIHEARLSPANQLLPKDL